MKYQSLTSSILSGLDSVLSGKSDKSELLLITLLSGGHLLLEDVPGVGKTTLAKTAAQVLGLSFGRIQFTPDTLPGDITGISVYRMETGEFTYMPGAVMHQIVLADEINRTAPKTQASLLEAMEERQVTVDGIPHALPKPFFVIATQNPIDFLGTYHLPEAQLDRFFMKISLGYPDHDSELEMADRYLKGTLRAQMADSAAGSGTTPAGDSTLPEIGAETVLAMQQEVADITIHRDLIDYIIQITEATRKHESLILGASPRATLCLIRGAQASAYLAGRDYVIPDDIKRLIYPILSHRLLLSTEARMKKMEPAAILKQIVQAIRVPVITR